MQAETEQVRPAQLFVISYLDWEREGASSFELQRARLLDQLSKLTAMQETSEGQSRPGTYVLLGGQTIILSDIAAIHPNLLTMLVIFNASGKLGTGPWYVQTDPMLVSGESLVRNLLIGATDVMRYGVRPLSIVYLPDGKQYPAQLPQILHGFGLHAILFHADHSTISVPFMWRAPQGSAVLVVPYRSQGNAQQARDQQQQVMPDGPFLWLNDDALNNKADVARAAAQSSLDAYVQSLRKQLPDEMRPRTHGELRLSAGPLPDGQFSARLVLKQAHRQLENRLTYLVERLLALAMTEGRFVNAETQRVLLDHAWRLLLQNQARKTISGAVGDLVQAHTLLRKQQITDVSDHIVQTALDALPGIPHKQTALAESDDLDADADNKNKKKNKENKNKKENKENKENAAADPTGDGTSAQSASQKTYVVVWNPHGFACTQVIDCGLQLPDDMQPLALHTPDDVPVAFSWDAGSARYSGRLYFRAEVPPVGYAVYTLHLTDAETPEQYRKHNSEGRIIASPTGETFGVEDRRITWGRGGQTISDVLTFQDGGDAGDATAYRKPQQDYLVSAVLTDRVKTVSTAVYERIIFRHRMRIAPELTGSVRRRGLRVLDITTSATFYDTLPGVHLRTFFSNAASDHRLRVHINTDMQSDEIWVDAPFALGRRLMDDFKGQNQAMHSLCALQDQNQQRALALLTRGLPEFEAIKAQDGRTQLALTLLRSVGWLDAAQTQRAVGAQMHRDITAEYLLLPQAKLDPAALWQASQAYQMPLQAFQYDNAPQTDGQRQHSYLRIADERVILSALKPPQHVDGWVVRLFNPTTEPLLTNLAPSGTLAGAEMLNMAEAVQDEIEVRQNRVNVRLEPQQVQTIRLRFEH